MTEQNDGNQQFIAPNNEHRGYDSLKMQALGRLVGGVAHDFNNILTTIQGNAELLKTDGFPQAERDDMLAQILEASRRASNINRQLLRFARNTGGKTAVVSANAIISETGELLSHGISKRIDIKRDLQADPSSVRVDPSQLKSVLLNLGMNACEAMSQGGVLALTTRNTVLDAESPGGGDAGLPPGAYVEICVRGLASDKNGHTSNGVSASGPANEYTGPANIYDCIKSLYGNIQADDQPGREAIFRLLLLVATD